MKTLVPYHQKKNKLSSLSAKLQRYYKLLVSTVLADPPKARLIICQDNWSQYEGDLSANQVHKPVPNIFQSRDINNTKKPHNVEMVKAQNSQQNGSEGGRWGGRGGGRGQFIISIHMKCKNACFRPFMRFWSFPIRNIGLSSWSPWLTSWGSPSSATARQKWKNVFVTKYF